MTLGKLHNCSEPQLPNGDNNTDFTVLGVSENVGKVSWSVPLSNKDMANAAI